MILSEDNIRKTSVFVLLMLRAYVYAYVAAVFTSVRKPNNNLNFDSHVIRSCALKPRKICVPAASRMHFLLSHAAI